MIYSPPSYAMGSDDLTNERRARSALRQMRRSLERWLGYRRRLDAYVRGEVKPPALFKRARPLPPSAVAVTLRRDRFRGEQDLADTLHALLIESGCSAPPSPDVARDPDAAVKLAQVAISGECPEPGPTAPGMAPVVWFALAIPIAGVALVLLQLIKSRADVEMERERLRCIQAGACTDAGFWLKVGAVAVVGWLAWSKFGLREAVEKRK